MLSLRRNLLPVTNPENVLRIVLLSSVKTEICSGVLLDGMDGPSHSWSEERPTTRKYSKAAFRIICGKCACSIRHCAAVFLKASQPKSYSDLGSRLRIVETYN